MGTVMVTEKLCDTHKINHIRIMTGGRKPWDLGCPQCNYEEWQKKKAAEPPKPVTVKKTPVKKAAVKKVATEKKVTEKKPRAAAKKSPKAETDSTMLIKS
jgi:DNA topoisomerase-1